MSGTNAQIPLSFNPTPNIGPNIGNAIGQAQQIMALQQAQTEVKRQNALRGILGAPGALDPMGQPTTDTLSKVMSVDPGAGMKLHENALVTQQRKMQMDVLKSKSFTEQMGLISDTYTPIYETYLKERESNPVTALRHAQDATTSATESLKTGGVFPPEQIGKLPTAFDPIKFQQMAAGTQMHRDWLKEQDTQRRSDQAATGTGTLSDGSEVIIHPNAPPGKQVTYMGTGAPVPPEKLQNMRKGGTGETPAANAEKDALTIANANIAKREKDLGRPLTDDEKAAERQQARSAPKIDTAGREAAARDASKHIPDDVSRNIAEQYVATGNPTVLAGFRRSPAMIAQIEGDILKVQNEKGMTPRDVARQSADFAAYTQGVRAFEAGGKLEPTVRSLSVVTGHLGILGDAANQLHNGTFQPTNAIGNAISKFTGDKAPTDFEGVKRIVNAEILKAVQGSAGALGDRESLDKEMSQVNSPEQLQGLVERYKQLMGGQLAGLRQTYDRLDTGKDFDETYLTKDAKENIAKYAPRAYPLGKTGDKSLPAAQIDEGAQLPRITADDTGKAAYDKLPPHSHYIGPDGVTYWKGGPPPSGGSTAASTAKPEVNATPSASPKYIDGKTYVDAQGNRAVYRNGKFDPVP